MIIYVAGYPKSGTTWLTRLLGEALHCPTGASIDAEDDTEAATEGKDRPDDMVVRKGHFRLVDSASVELVPERHMMNWRNLIPAEHKIVFLIRDPRDIAVSAAYYWDLPVSRSLHYMITGTGKFRFNGAWELYIRSWLARQRQIGFVITKYEDLLLGHTELSRVIRSMGLRVPEPEIKSAYRKQSFDAKLKDIKRNGDKYNLGKDLNLRLLRKGVSGEWRTHFEPRDAEVAEKAFGELMRLFNYTSNPSWVRLWS